MKTRDIQKRVFEACIELLDNNVVTTIPYLLFVIFDTVIKGIYGIGYIFHFIGVDGITFLQNQQSMGSLIFFIAAYLMIIVSLLLIAIFTGGSEDNSNIFRSLLRKTLITTLKANNTFLMVPILVVIFQTFRIGIQTSFEEDIQVYHLAVAIITLIIQISLYLFTENFVFCFFPNKQIPWSRPMPNIDLLKYANNTTFAILLIFDHKSITQVSKTFLKSNKTIKDFKIQLVELIRTSTRNKLDLVISLQSWIIQHKQACSTHNCKCIMFKLHDIQNINSRMYRQVNQEGFEEHNELDDEEIPQESIVYQDVNMLSAVQQEFYMSQFLEDMEIQHNENPRDFEKRQLLKLQSTVIQLVNSEIEENGKLDTQLQFLKICVDIFLKNQSYRAYFKILQLQQSLIKLSMKQEFILAYLKKYLINRMNQKEKFKKNSEKIYILNQLKFEVSFQKFIVDVQKVTETVDTLWKQSANKSYKILAMTELMEKISHDYIIIWTKYQEIEGKYLNPELLIVLARFCDLVMGFELEAENLMQKGQSLLNSIKLQQQKGQLIEENLENKIKSQELLFNVHCSPKCLDKIAFANLKFLQFAGYKIDEIPTIKSMQPSIIASGHDEKITHFLQKNEKTSSKINIDSWMKVKQGYIVPIMLKSIPYIDLKHDLRFITLCKPKNDFEIEDTKYQYNQAFFFLVNSFGRVDSASQECHNLLQIGQKMIENGLSLQQIFIGFDLDRVTDYSNGQEFQLDKNNLVEIQNQLDIHQEDSPTQYESLGKIGSFSKIESKNMQKIFMSESAPPIFMKLFIKPSTSINPEMSYYEVIAMPVQPEQTSIAITNAKMHSNFQSTNLKNLEIMDSGLQKISGVEEDSMHQNDIGSQSSITSSQTSRSDKSFQLIRDIKEITQLKGMPPLILKLKRSMNVFFFVMLVTAIVLLVVNIVDKVSFKQDIQAVEEAFRIQYFISNVRLRFQYLYVQSNNPLQNFTTDRIFTYEMIQHQLGLYVEEFRQTINSLGFAVQLLSDQLENLFLKNDIKMLEISRAGTLYNTSSSFQSGCQEIITKADQYQYMNYTALKIGRSIFGVQYGSQTKSNYSLSSDEINQYFIIQNLAQTLRLRANDIEADFSSEVIRFGNQSQQNILIFTLVCVIVVVIAGILLLPMLFTIDNALRESILTWTQIRQEQKEEQINRINIFKDFLEQTDFLNQRGGMQSKKLRQVLKDRERVNEVLKGGLDKSTTKIKINMHTDDKGNIIEKLGMNNHSKVLGKAQNKYLQNIQFEEDLVEEEEKKADDEINSPKNQLNNRKKNLNNFSNLAKQHKQTKNGRVSKNQDDIQSESDDEDDQDQNAKKHKNKMGEDLASQSMKYHEETDAERIHRFSQIIALNKYTFTRKLRMGTIIIAFTIGLCSMYIGSYLLASTIYEETLDNFDILTTISQRVPCVGRNYFFLMNQYVRNSTSQDGTQLEDEQVVKLLEQCQKIESDIRVMKKERKLDRDIIKSSLDQADSKQFCQFYYNEISEKYARNESERTFLLNQCNSLNSGLLNLGVSSSINSMFHSVEQSNIYYMTANRTLKSLQTLLYDKDLETMLLMFFNFVGPVLDRIQRLSNSSLYLVLENAFNNVIVMFTIFLAFLVITWYFSIRTLIKALSKTLSRSKISVKMIPASILIEIKESSSLISQENERANNYNMKNQENDERQRKKRSGKKQQKIYD
eukprot:403332344